MNASEQLSAPAIGMRVFVSSGGLGVAQGSEAPIGLLFAPLEDPTNAVSGAVVVRDVSLKNIAKPVSVNRSFRDITFQNIAY